MIDDKIFRQYDIRGVVGQDLSSSIAETLGKAYSVFLKQRNPSARSVSVGRDVRLSSEDLSTALIRGIVSTGLDVYDIGVCPTPLQYFSLFHLSLDGGIMITGSHNPPEYNGFKLSVGKETIFGQDIQEIRQIMLGTGASVEGESKGKVHSYAIIPAYKNYVLKNLENIAGGYENSKKLKIVVDAGNGTAGLVAPDLLKSLECEVIELYCEPDGRFPNHHPDPTVVEYIKDLINEVKREKADFGVGYDGDADRIGIVNADGNIIWGDQLMIVLSRDILKNNPGAKIIGDVKCSQAMFDDIEKHGGMPVMNKTGHSLVKNRMKTEGALLAGEFSGHIFIADRYFGYDDAVYTTLRIAEIMIKTGKSLSELLYDIPEMMYTPEIRIDCPDDRKEQIVDNLVSRIFEIKEDGSSPLKIVDLITIDGIRVVFDKGWGLLRASNTQPVLVMRFEAEDERDLKNYRNFIESELQEVMKKTL